MGIDFPWIRPTSQLSDSGVTLHAAGRAGRGTEPVAVLVSVPAGLEVGRTETRTLPLHPSAKETRAE